MELTVSVLFLSPLLGSFINGWRWRSANVKLAGGIAATCCAFSFICSVVLFSLLLYRGLDAITISFLPWIVVGSFKASFSFLIDSLSVFMLPLITGVGFLIHIFSIYYMADDPRPAKYFAFLNLFLFSMLLLVLADNLLLMFVGWEGVGLCSYLLIGFWFHHANKALAGMKAFVINRVGDIGFLVAMFILFSQFNSLEFREIAVHSMVGGGSTYIGIALLCLILAAVGKSAQIPLYVWLPPAMAGPTPVSALIHAATMVTAGVYLICRMGFLFIQYPNILHLLSWIGAFSALWAACVAAFQTDIKKVLAYSTISQLGYMFIAVGLGAFSSGLFHLMTHAFFKALLFLSAGSVIHFYAGEQNILKMGGLKSRAPLVWFNFLVGGLALMGIPPLAGFFSKDEILWSALSSGHLALLIIASLTALLTAFYMTRLLVLVFYGSARTSVNFNKHSLGIYGNFPLIILSILTLCTGLFGIPHLIAMYLPMHPPHLLQVFLKPAIAHFEMPQWFYSSVTQFWAEIVLMLSSSFLVLLVIICTSYLYLQKLSSLEQLKNKYLFLCSVLKEGGYVDSIYQRCFVHPILYLSRELEIAIDFGLIQKLILFLQYWVLSLRTTFMAAQNGKMQHYAMYMLLGISILILGTLFR